MVGVSTSVNILSLHHKVQKYSSGTVNGCGVVRGIFISSKQDESRLTTFLNIGASKNGMIAYEFHQHLLLLNADNYRQHCAKLKLPVFNLLIGRF